MVKKRKASEELEHVTLEREKLKQKMEIRTLIALHRLEPTQWLYSVEQIEKALEKAERMKIDTIVYEKKLPSLKRQEIVAIIRLKIRLFKYNLSSFCHFKEELEDRLDEARRSDIDTTIFEKQLPQLERLAAVRELENKIEAKEKKTIGLEPKTVADIWVAYDYAKSLGCHVYKKYMARIKALESAEQGEEKQPSKGCRLRLTGEEGEY